MKIKRYKRVRRLLNFYKHTFQFSPPFKILVDGTFCQAALENKLNLREQIPIYLNGCECHFFTTICVRKELQALGGQFKGALSIANDYNLIKCKHPRPLSASQCLFKMAGENNGKKYFFASQDQTLTEKLRTVPGCPLLFIKYNCVLLEKPSQMSTEAKGADSEQKLNFQGTQREELQKLLHAHDLAPKPQKPERLKRKKIRQPNPLSCKKKKPKLATPNSKSTLDRKKRPRRRKNETEKCD